MHTYEELLKSFSLHLEKETFTGTPPELYEPIDYMMDLGGKRLRPIILLLACDAFGGDIKKAMPAALSLEMFHNFTLVHDDIMDGADIRRGKDTIWHIWGEDTAILVGDTMFAMAFEYLLKTDSPNIKMLLQSLVQVSKEVCEGQQLDMNFETEEGVSIPDYFAMIRLKTAVLIGTALKMGAILGGATEEDANNMYNFGINIGMAFQLKDDLLDVFGSVDKFGKMPGGDIVSDKKTFLMLKTMTIASEDDKNIIEDWFGEGYEEPEQKIMDITSIYSKLHIDKITVTEMERYFERAEYHMGLISLADEKKAELMRLANKMMYRDH